MEFIRLYTSSATNPPKHCDNMYGTKSPVGSLPAAAIVIDTAGLICPPEILLVNKITRAYAAPMAKGFPVAKII